MEQERLLGVLQEHARHIDSRLNRIEVKVDSLVAFKWRILGFAACAAFVATLLVEFAKAMGG